MSSTWIGALVGGPAARPALARRVLPRGRRRPRRYGWHYGAWQAVVCLPAVIGSVMIVWSVFAPVSSGWRGLAVLVFVALAVLGRLRPVERWVLRWRLRVRSPTPGEEALLWPAWQAALACTGYPSGRFDVYVASDRRPNAAAYGRRSIVVTAELLAHPIGRTPADGRLVALLVHEIGHHATGATGYQVAVGWLVWPARAGYRLLVAVITGVRTGVPPLVRGPHPSIMVPVSMVVGCGAMVAAGLRQHQPGAAVGGLVLAVCLAAPAPTRAAIARRSEYAADHYTAEHGLAGPLAAALSQIAPGPGPAWPARLLADHPTTAGRTRRLCDGAPGPACPEGGATVATTAGVAPAVHVA